MFESLFQKLSSLRRRDSDDAIDDMVNASVKNEGPSEDIKHDAEDIRATDSVSPHQAKPQDNGTRARAPSTDEITDIAPGAVLSERRRTDAPLSIANYQDLLLATQHRSSLGQISEYPPQPRKVEAVSVDVIMAFFADAIRQSADDLPMEREEIDTYFLPVVRRGLMYMHLLPASQFHHHNGIGGLFAHSLQVATLAVRLGKQKVFNQRDTPRELYQNSKRWLFGCWLAGFLHDIGKPVTDVIVTGDGETWYPYSSSLTAWLDDNNIREYHFIWQSAGHNRHQQSTLMFVREIVPQKTFDWLVDYGARAIWEACESTLVNPSKAGNLIAEVVQQADEFTSGEDIKARNEGQIDGRRMGGSLPAAEYIMDALRLLIADGVIRVNEKGSILHVTTSGTFIIWTTKASELIYARVLEEKHASVPRKIDRMLDCLVTGGCVEPVPQDVNPVGGYIWPVVYDMHPEHPFKSIKLRSTHVLFNGLVPPEPTLAIINGWEGQNPAVIEAWEAKHGKLLSETMTQSIPDASNVPAELVTDNTDPQAIAGEESYFASQADPVAAQLSSHPMEPQVDQATKTQLKAILSGNAMPNPVESQPETTGNVPSALTPSVKPDRASVENIKRRMADGDLSFLMPGSEPRSEEAAPASPSASATDRAHNYPEKAVHSEQREQPDTVPDKPSDSLESAGSSHLVHAVSMPTYEVPAKPVFVPKGNPPALTPKKLQATQTRASTSAGLSGRQPMSRTVDNRPRLGGKAISRKIPIEDAMLTSDVMAVLTGRRVQSAGEAAKPASQPPVKEVQVVQVAAKPSDTQIEIGPGLAIVRDNAGFPVSSMDTQPASRPQKTDEDLHASLMSTLLKPAAEVADVGNVGRADKSTKANKANQPNRTKTEKPEKTEGSQRQPGSQTNTPPASSVTPSPSAENHREVMPVQKGREVQAQELVFAGAAGYCDGNVANAANAGCSCDEPMTVVEMQAGQTVEITGVDAANPEEPPHGFIPGEEKHVEAEKDSEDNMRALYGDAALPEVPFLKQPVIREETYATREEAVKNQKRKDTLIARSEQNLVGVLANGEVTIVDTNKTMTQTSVIEKNHVDKNCENQKSSVEREVDGMSPAKRLREEIVDGMLAGVSPLFPTGLLSLTETERRADAAGTFARASSLGLTPEKVKALAIGFQPGDWKIAFEDQQDRVLIILKHK